jgi:hypothetical protein
MPLLQELSNELTAESTQLLRLKCAFGNYAGFAPAITGLEFIGFRLLGMVSLKGLDDVEVAEIVPFAPGDATATPIEGSEPLVTVLRQELHREEEETGMPLAMPRLHTTSERLIPIEIIVCVPGEHEKADEVIIGQWDPGSDDITRPLRIPRDDFKHLLSFRGVLDSDALTAKRDSVRELYDRLATQTPAAPLSQYRDGVYEAFVLGEVVEKL